MVRVRSMMLEAKFEALQRDHQVRASKQTCAGHGMLYCGVITMYNLVLGVSYSFCFLAYLFVFVRLYYQTTIRSVHVRGHSLWDWCWCYLNNPLSTRIPTTTGRLHVHDCWAPAVHHLSCLISAPKQRLVTASAFVWGMDTSGWQFVRVALCQHVSDWIKSYHRHVPDQIVLYHTWITDRVRLCLINHSAYFRCVFILG